MKILLIMDPGIPVPPVHYGGHERLVYLFAEEYSRLGHEVTLLAGPGSRCSGRVVTFGTNDLHRNENQRFTELRFVWRFLTRNRQFDLVHNFGRLLYLLPVLRSRTAKLMTYGRPVSKRGIMLINCLPNKHLTFTACSDYCVSTGNVAGKWHTIYNTIDFNDYTLNTAVPEGAPLIFLGRLDRIKGAHTAITVARTTGNRLIIAGNIPDSAESLAYFDREIAPHIDGDLIQYAGPLNDIEKNSYLKEAKALLFPIEWDEPFGIVMIEAMACGTPVIGFKRGSVPEVIDEGITGFQVIDLQGMLEATAKIGRLDRQKCRERAKNRFDVRKIATDYLGLLEENER